MLLQLKKYFANNDSSPSHDIPIYDPTLLDPGAEKEMQTRNTGCREDPSSAAKNRLRGTEYSSHVYPGVRGVGLNTDSDPPHVQSSRFMG